MKNKKLLTYALTFVAVFTLSFGLVRPLVANAGTREEYRAAQKKLEEINKEVSNIKSQKKKQEREKANAQKQIDLVKSQISIINGDISRTNKDLEEKQAELEVKKDELAQSEQLFKDRLRAMYMMRSNSGTLSTVLGANSFSELLTATDTLQRISVADTNLLKLLDQQRLEIEQQEADLQDKLNQLEVKQQTMQNKQKELAGYMQTLNENLSETEALQQAAEQTQSEVYAQYRRAKRAFEAELAQIQSSQTEFVGGEYIWPVPTRGHVSSPYGTRYLFGVKDFHTGIDIAKGSYGSIMNEPIVASNAGTVVRATRSSSGYGNCVMIDHGGNNYTLYGHCASLAVSYGQYVNQGQVVAYVGSTGNSTGPHLHFEIRLNGSAIGNAVDPYPYVRGSQPAG